MADLLDRGFWAALLFALSVAGLIVRPLIQRFFVETVHEQAKAITDVAYSLTLYAPFYANPGKGVVTTPEKAAASKALRENASRLIATTSAIPSYRLVRFLSGWRVPQRKAAMEAAQALIGLSNSIVHGDEKENLERRQLIEKNLRLRLRA